MESKKSWKTKLSLIHRVFNFWIQKGLIYKIHYLNKYITFKKPEESNTHVVNLCAKYENILVTCYKKIKINLDEFSSKLGLTFAKSSHLNIPVICRNCSC